MNYIIFDLEATCWQTGGHGQGETIEIGAVLINEHRELVAEFSRFIKPIKHPILSDFCIELTSIQQSDVDTAGYFREVVEAFQDWIGLGDKDYLLCSWGFYDRKQLESDCKLHGVEQKWLEKHISLKHQYGDFKQLRRKLGMKRALMKEGMDLEGTHHRGIDDARNIAKIFVKYFDRWKLELKGE